MPRELNNTALSNDNLSDNDKNLLTMFMENHNEEKKLKIEIKRRTSAIKVGDEFISEYEKDNMSENSEKTFLDYEIFLRIAGNNLQEMKKRLKELENNREIILSKMSKRCREHINNIIGSIKLWDAINRA